MQPVHLQQRAFQPAGDVVGQGKAPLDLARPAPVEQQRPDAGAGQEPQHRMAGREVEHIGAVHQAGHEQHRRCGSIAAVIQQPGFALGPDRRRIGQVARPGMAAIGGDPRDQSGVISQAFPPGRRRVAAGSGQSAYARRWHLDWHALCRHQAGGRHQAGHDRTGPIGVPTARSARRAERFQRREGQMEQQRPRSPARQRPRQPRQDRSRTGCHRWGSAAGTKPPRPKDRPTPAMSPQPPGPPPPRQARSARSSPSRGQDLLEDPPPAVRHPAVRTRCFRSCRMHAPRASPVRPATWDVALDCGTANPIFKGLRCLADNAASRQHRQKSPFAVAA